MDADVTATLLLAFTGMVDAGPFDGSDWMRDYRFRVFVATADGSDLRWIAGDDAVAAGYPRWDPGARSLTYMRPGHNSSGCQ